MKKFDISIHKKSTEIAISNDVVKNAAQMLERHGAMVYAWILAGVSILFYVIFYLNKLGLAYNDARSHLNIARRVVEGLKPGAAQLGSVWLPLPHALMVLTVWNDFMWHSGLAGAIISMISFVVTSLVIYLFLKELSVGMVGRIMGVLVFATNSNILYLQSTSMTELLLLASMALSIYFLLLWYKYEKLSYLVLCGFWTMLSTLNRYDGWFLFLSICMVNIALIYKLKGYKAAEGALILFATLGGVGIILWFGWNLLIFGDPLYFAFGPFSAHAQQEQIQSAGELLTKGNIYLSLKTYFFAAMYNTYSYTPIAAALGVVALIKDKKLTIPVKIATLTLLSALVFNILALFLGHSVLFVPGIMGNTWFNVRYGVMIIPAVAIFFAFAIDRLKNIRWLLIGLFFFVSFFAWTRADAVTIDDAKYGSSQKNVTEVSGWLAKHANTDGYVLISAASHDAIIFSSGLPMKKFIHEGTGKYWDEAVHHPDEWARWIVLRTNDMNDLTFRSIYKSPGFKHYDRVQTFPFADIYQIKPEYETSLHPHKLIQ